MGLASASASWGIAHSAETAETLSPILKAKQLNTTPTMTEPLDFPMVSSLPQSTVNFSGALVSYVLPSLLVNTTRTGASLDAFNGKVMIGSSLIADDISYQATLVSP